MTDNRMTDSRTSPAVVTPDVGEAGPQRRAHPLLRLFGRAADLTAFTLLLVTVLYAPVAQGSLYPWSLFGLRSLVALTLAVAGLSVALRGRLELPPPWVTATYGGFLALYAVSAAVSPNAFGTQQALVTTLVHAAGFPLAVILVRGKRRRGLFLAALLTAALAMGVYGMLQVLGYGFTPSLHEGPPPISSFYFSRIHYAGFLDLAAPTALALLLFGSRWWVRTIAGALALLLYLNLGLTFSDAGWVAVGSVTLALLGVWVITAPRRLKGVRVGLVSLMLLAGVAGLGTFLYYSPDFSGSLEQRMLSLRGTTAEGDPSGTGLGGLYSRLEIHRRTLHIVEEHPWVGVGPGNFIYAFPKWRPETATGNYINGLLHGFVNYAHNDYLQIASEAGVPAALLFTLFWFAVLAASRGPPSPLTGLRFGLVALLLHGLVDGNLTVNHAVAFLAFVTAGVVVVARPREGAVS